jgi:hypothetical protein
MELMSTYLALKDPRRHTRSCYDQGSDQLINTPEP